MFVVFKNEYYAYLIFQYIKATESVKIYNMFKIDFIA